MMSTDAAVNKLASARMTMAAPFLGDAWAPAGAAGFAGFRVARDLE
jgi:hypothetical protein